MLKSRKISKKFSMDLAVDKMTDSTIASKTRQKYMQTVTEHGFQEGKYPRQQKRSTIFSKNFISKTHCPPWNACPPLPLCPY